MKIKLTITFTNLIGAIGFLYSVFNRFSDTEILMYSVILILGRQIVPELSKMAESIAKIVTAKKGSK